MPYVITTKQMEESRERNADGTLTLGGRHSVRRKVMSRRAVATLDEAKREVVAPMLADLPNLHPAIIAYDALPESGGTVGPLPDGTAIEVERVDWRSLALIADIPNVPSRVDVLAVLKSGRILDAYNAAQEGD